MPLSSCKTEDLKELLALLADLKKKGLTRGSVVMSFCCRLIQPIKDRVVPAYEYWGQSDPTREVNHKVSIGEMVTRVMQLYIGQIWNKKCPKVHSLTRPADPVSLEITSSSQSVYLLCTLEEDLLDLISCLCRLGRCSIGALHLY
jgi:hypothetical protein